MPSSQLPSSGQRPKSGSLIGACMSTSVLLTLLATTSFMGSVGAFVSPQPSSLLLAKNTMAVPRNMPPFSSTVAAQSLTMNAPKALLMAQEDDKDEPLRHSINSRVPLPPETEINNGELVEGKTSKVVDDSQNQMVALLSNMGDAMSKMMNTVTTKYAVLAAMFLLFLTVFMSPLPSLAVTSGGRIGGSFGSSQRSNSATYSAPARSYGSSYSSGFNRGFSSGYYSRPSVVVNPYPSPFFSPFYSPFWAPTYYSRPGVVVSSGGGFFSFVAFFGIALAAVFAMSNFIGSAGSGIMEKMDTAVGSALGPGVSVAEISVALDVSNRDDPNSILNVLRRLSNTARTDSRVGIQNLTSQVALELLRRKNQIIASSSRSTHYRDSNKASREFNKLAVKERGKFERETVSRYGGVDYSQTRQERDLTQYSPKATMAVVTLIVAIEGDSTKLPQIRSQRDVEEALAKIASDSKVDDCLQSAEILWTPEERSETLTMRDVISDYPELRTI